METKYYTYAYLRKDRTPYYIGKGHGERAFRKSGRRCPRPKDKSRILFLKTGLTQDEANKHEVYMISVFGRKDKGTGILRNLTDGGEGTSGNKRSEEFCKRMSEVHSGKTISQAHKKRLREAHTGRKHTEEHKRKVSEALRGKKKPPISQETRKKMSIAAKKKYGTYHE